MLGRVGLIAACTFSLHATPSLGQPADLTAMISIPAGSFLMGSDDGPADERPAHRVELPAFSIDRTPVTNRQFSRFLDAVGPRGPRDDVYYDVDDTDSRIHRRGGAWHADPGAEDHPVVEASW